MKDYKKYYILKATPEEVFAALTFPPTIKLWSGENAVMSVEPGSEFSLWEGSITGTNLEFETGRKIVQKWDFEGSTDDSIVTIILHPHQQGTSVELRHVNIPDEAYENITEGWDEAYFGALMAFYEN